MSLKRNKVAQDRQPEGARCQHSTETQENKVLPRLYSSNTSDFAPSIFFYLHCSLLQEERMAIVGEKIYRE